MIPILYRVGELNFSSNGIGRLVDCTSCIVTEERNGIYECEFKYPITGRFYHEMITNGGVVSVIHDDRKDTQLFDIYAHTDPIDGIVTFNAHHISYRLANIILQPFTSASVADVMDDIPLNTMNDCPFTFWTDKITIGEFDLTHPSNIRAILCGQEGSILDVYGGGDYEFDGFAVKLYANRGYDTGVTIRYGKNLSDISNKYDDSGTYSAIVPYWTGSESETVYGGIVYSDTMRSVLIPWTRETGDEMENGRGVVIDFPYVIITPVEMDFTDQFETEPTVEELETAAKNYMTRNKTWQPYHNIEVDFVQLWQTPEYASVAALQRVSMCDTVSVYFPEMGIIEAEQKVIKTVYNVLLERYDSMELGQAKTTYSSTLTDGLDEAINQQSNFLRQFIMTQTELITGGLGGYVVMTMNANNQPQEILIMDTDDIETAVNVIRMNKNGIGFSTNGYSGPFESAWTIDGKFNANFIATGYLVANHIRGGTLSLGGYDNENGLFQLLNADGTVNFQYDKDGMHHVTIEEIGGVDNSFGTEISETKLYTFWYVDQSIGWKTVLTNGRLYTYYSTSGGLTDDSREFKRVGYLESFYSNGLYTFAITNMGGKNADFNPSSIQLSSDGTTKTVAIFGDTTISGSFRCSGTKNRIFETTEFGNRLMYSYETASPLFGDVGEGVIDETGFCYVFLDPVFAETISTQNYQVFLQKYGHGDCWIAERHSDYFVVQGTEGLSFGWELKAKQADFDQNRLEQEDAVAKAIIFDFGDDAADYFESLQEGRIAS